MSTETVSTAREQVAPANGATKRDVIESLIRGGPAIRMGHNDGFWNDTLSNWVGDGYPTVEVKATGADGKLLPGRTFDDCVVLTGDRLEKPVTWRGQDGLGLPDDQPVTLRFRLRASELFNVRFV